MSREELRAMYSADHRRRVILFRRRDGTYGFEEQVSDGPQEAAWRRSGHDSASRFESEGLATYECLSRVGWLAELLAAGGVPEGAAWRKASGPPPKTIGRLPVVCFSLIDERHRCADRPFVYAGGRLGIIAGLAVCGEGGFHLFTCDSEWNPLADTWHPTVEDAMAAGEEGYEGVSRTWERPA
jgi:hypothetical protein